MAKIWTDDNEYADVTTIEQSLWHLKVMRGGIRSCLNSPSSLQHMDEDDIKIERVQEQVLTVAIDYIKQNIIGVDAEPYEWLSHQEYCERHHYKPSDMAEIDRQEKWLMDAGYNAYNIDIAFDAIKKAVERKGKE